jgi:membrane fusion protein (multidrug efflux system)
MRLSALKLIFLGMLLFSCTRSKKEVVDVSVETFIVEPRTAPFSLDFIGVCQSSHLVEIRPRVQGYLEKVAFTEGSFVEKEQLLFKIDPREYESRVAEDQANLEKENAVLWSAQKAVERYQPLYEQKAASRKDWEDAKSQLLAQQATVNYAKAKLDESQLKLSYTDITSPIAGLTTNSRFQEGTFINPAVNEVLTTVSVIDPIWVIVNVSDSYFLESTKEVAQGRLMIPKNFDFDVNLILSDGSEYPQKGRVNFISPVLSPTTGTLSVRAVFPNPQGLLKPGQFVRAKVTGAKWLNAIFVPQSAVLQGDTGRYVYVLVPGNRVEKRKVETGAWYDNFWIIDSGLKKGDEVISSGINKIKEGMVVKVVNRPKKG